MVVAIRIFNSNSTYVVQQIFQRVYKYTFRISVLEKVPVVFVMGPFVDKEFKII